MSEPWAPFEQYEAEIADLTAERDAAREEAARLRVLLADEGEEVRDLFEEAARLREALEEIAEPTLSDPIHREYPSVKRLIDRARAALAIADQRAEAKT